MSNVAQLTNPRRGRALLAIGAIVAVLVVIAIAVFAWAVGISNNIVKLDQGADAAWAQVQSQYQRRLDLIPNLVNTVKGAAAQEVQVVVGAVQERAKATQVNINPSDPAQFKQFAESQAALGGALSRLLVTVERYPEIRTNQNFLELQSQIEGTENRISVERGKFNEAVQAYNNGVLTFPGSLIAGFRNFEKRPFFAGTADSQTAPTVDFATPAPSPAGGVQAPAVPPPGAPAATSATPAAPALPPPGAPAPATSPSASLPPEG